MTLEELKTKGLFDPDSWPEDLAMPGEETVSKVSSEGGTDTYQYATGEFGMRVTIDTATCPEPEWGVVHMLSQVAWYWRSDKSKITVSGGSVPTISF